MQGNRGNMDPFFGGFDDIFGGFGGFSGQRSLFSSVFGGGDPFDDPFFTQPFGSMFGSSVFGSARSPFTQMPACGFLEHQVPQRKSRGPVIEEIHSDDEEQEEANEKNPRKHRRPSKEPYVEDPDDATEERKSKQVQYSNSHNGARSEPQTRCFTMQSSTVTYGGANGAYYTSSKSRRTGSDGLTLEEHKEADTSTGQATHNISRGIHNKGHSLRRKLNSDGRVDTMQTLHNLNEDELTGFENDWSVSARQNIPGWSERFNALASTGHSNGGQYSQANRGGWALPSTEQPRSCQRMNPTMEEGAVHPHSSHPCSQQRTNPAMVEVVGQPHSSRPFSQQRMNPAMWVLVGHPHSSHPHLQQGMNPAMGVGVSHSHSSHPQQRVNPAMGGGVGHPHSSHSHLQQGMNPAMGNGVGHPHSSDHHLHHHHFSRNTSRGRQ